MFDLHMHILPAVDDGAESAEESLEMARMAAQSGILGAAASSHANLYRGAKKCTDIGTYVTAFNAFRQRLATEKIPLTLYPAMEIMADRHAAALLQAGRLLTINQSRYPLVEFYFDCRPGYMSERLSMIQAAGYTPVLAHPERYDCIRRNPGLLYELYEKGIILQVNKGSILGYFGSSVRHMARWMLMHRLAGLVASDAHNTYSRTPDMEEVVQWLEINLGMDSIRVLLDENPRAILSDVKIKPARPV